MTKYKHYMFTQHALGVGEGIFGLGERFTPFNKLGQQVVLYNADGGTSSEQAYKNISFYMSSHGYGIFIDHPEPVELEIGSERTCRLQTSIEGQRLKQYIIFGPTPKSVLRKYTGLLGRPPLLPLWSYGLWLSTSFTTEYDEETVSHFLTEMATRELPVSVFHYDCFWLREFHWCDFVWSPDFPDPLAMTTRLRNTHKNLKFCVWTNPYIGDASPIFREAADAGYLVRRTNGDIWQWDLWQAGMGLVDFTNPAACAWYASKLRILFELGIDTLKTDFGERIPDTDVVFFDKTLDVKKMHNFYTYTYNQLVFETLEQHTGAGNAVLFARSATAGCQRFPLQWGGDCESTYEAMAESIRGGLSLGLSGFAYWSVDIGGFEGTPPAHVYKRWLAFGLLCSHSRLHGSNSYRVPWAVDTESTAVLSTFVKLKCMLMPYIFSLGASATKTGLPVSLRATLLEFPEDPTAWTLDRQFMLGDALLVAPVMREDGKVTFYLPAGRWTGLLTGEVKHGPAWITETHGFHTLPLYVRGGSLLLLGPKNGLDTEYDWQRTGRVAVYPPASGGVWRDYRHVVDQQGKAVGHITVGPEEGEEGRVRVMVENLAPEVEIVFIGEGGEEEGVEKVGGDETSGIYTKVLRRGEGGVVRELEGDRAWDEEGAALGREDWDQWGWRDGRGGGQTRSE